MHVQALVAQAPVEGTRCGHSAGVTAAVPASDPPASLPAQQDPDPHVAEPRPGERELADAHAPGGLVLGAALPIPGGATGLVDFYVRGLIPTLPRVGTGARSTTPAAGPPPPPPPPTVRRGEPAGCRAVGLAAHHRHRTPGGILALVTTQSQRAGGSLAFPNTLAGLPLQSINAFW